MSSPDLRSRNPGVIVPAYQAASSLGRVLDGLAAHFPPDRILVVDDGSSDGTEAVARGRGVLCLKHGTNRGKGSALMTGLLHARDIARWEWALTVDADGQHAFDDLRGFFSSRPDPKTGILVGCRARQGTRMPWHRRFSNAFTTWIVSRLAGRPVYDAQCGYRAYRLDGLDAFPREGRFEWEAQALILCCRAGRAVEQVPVRTVYGEEGSHMRLGRDTWRFLRMAGRLAWTR